MKGKILDINTIGAERRKKKKIWTYAAMVVSVAFLVLGAWWVVRWSGVFSVREIVIEGAHYVSSDYVREVVEARMFVEGERWKLIFGTRHMWSWPDTLSGAGLFIAPEIKKITIEKNYENRRIILRVEERARAGIWCFGGDGPVECVWFDNEGVALRKTFSGAGSLIVIVHDYTQRDVPLGGKVLEARLFQNLQSAVRAVQDSELRIREIRIEDLSREEVVMLTYDGPYVMASVRFPLRGVSEALDAIKKQKDIGTLEYIDFRVEGRVYYK